MTLPGERTLPRPGGSGPGGSGAGGGASRVCLVAFHRDGARVAELNDERAVVIGRSMPSDLVFEDKMLSRQHARFSLTDGTVAVEDLDSTNGTTVNGERVRRSRVRPGDDVRLGDIVVSLHVERGAVDLPHGVESLDRLQDALDDECVRAASFSRRFTLAMIRSARRGVDAHAARWAAPLLAALRPVDRAALYGTDSLIVLFPEQPLDATRLRVDALIANDTMIRAALAEFPSHGAQGDALFEAVRTALHANAAGGPTAAGARERIVVAPGDGVLEAAASGTVVARSPAMRELLGLVARVSPSVLPVLVLGETGSGKEVVARAIHAGSARAAGPMRSVNCATIPGSLLESTLFGHEKGAFTGAERTARGLFEQAHGGTVFLDEVGELSPAAQAALLRVLETRTLTRVGGEREIQVDVRVVAATHRDLEALCEQNAFRWDLYYRLNGLTLRLPTLRERPDDIDALIETFIAEANLTHGRRVRGVEPAALEALRAWRWPGNVRELRNAVDRGVVMARGERIEMDDLPERVRAAALGAPAVPAAMVSRAGPSNPASAAPTSSAPPSESGFSGAIASTDDGEYKERVRRHMQDYETQLLVEALQRYDWNITEAARALQMPVRTLTHKMQTFGIRRPSERG